MDQNKIKFNRVYSKFIDPVSHRRCKVATLIEVIPYHYEDLSPAFKLYDIAGSNYIIPDEGECIIVIFRTNYGIFTTLRNLTEANLKFYRSKVGERFKIIIDKC